MRINDFYDSLIPDDTIVRESQFNPYYPVLQSGLDDPVWINGKPFINLASNNYLGLANDTEIKKACIKGLESYGVCLCATPIASGYPELYYRVEKKLSLFIGLEKVLIYPSCYQANNGLFKSVTSYDDLVLVDKSVHSSLVEGIRSGQARLLPFRHNDLEHLESMLAKKKGFRQVFVVTESVFSTEGHIAPLAQIYDLCKCYNAITVVDDSHGIGVLGKSGKGILEHEGIVGFEGIYTASLGKSLAINGGVIAGKAELIEHLKYYSSHLVYSTAVPPFLLAGLERTLELVESEFTERSSRMWSYKEQIYNALTECGLEICDSQSAINSLKTGDPVNTFRTAKMVHESGILATPFVYPSVPFNEGRIRLIAGSNLKAETVDRACGILSNIACSIAL